MSNVDRNDSRHVYCHVSRHIQCDGHHHGRWLLRRFVAVGYPDAAE